jgi:biotin synthase
MINTKIESITKKVLEGYEIEKEDALFLSQSEDVYDILYCANKIKEKFLGKKMHFCSIVNAKSGACTEDCKFCAQSAHYNTFIKEYPLLKKEEIVNKAKEALKWKSNVNHCFGIVTSGKMITNEIELETICESVKEINKLGFYSCTSLGELNEEIAQKLKLAGLVNYHHNLETSARYFPQVCSTHDYESKIKTIRIAKKYGFKICCGGIFGMGESWIDRIELAFKIKEFDVAHIPINFLNPRPGTPFENMNELTPMECLKIIAIFRFIHPNKDILTSGGREVNLKDFQSWMYYAGANGTLIGDYLTTSGRPYYEDIQILNALGLWK